MTWDDELWFILSFAFGLFDSAVRTKLGIERIGMEDDIGEGNRVATETSPVVASSFGVEELELDRSVVSYLYGSQIVFCWPRPYPHVAGHL
jgi:hypothetical protein